jgi:hypothetical protein
MYHEDGGMDQESKIRCIRVVNIDTGEKVLINGMITYGIPASNSKTQKRRRQT